MSTEFIPPQLNPGVVDFLQIIFPLYAEFAVNLKVELDDSVHEQFAAIENASAVICANHAASEDPIVAFGVSSKVHQKFHFIATREIFEWHPSMRSVWLQQLGCYSVLRAAPDLQSYKTTRELLLTGNNKMMVFPEGEITRQNRTLIPLEIGPMYMAADAAFHRMESGTNGPIFILPLAFLYRFDKDITKELDVSLAQCEEQLSISKRSHSYGERLYQCFDEMLRVREEDHQFKPKAGTIEFRVDRLASHIVRELQCASGAEVPPKMDLIDRLHLLKNAYTKRRYCDGLEPSEEIKAQYLSLLRATNLIALNERSFRAPLDQEQVFELLQILHMELQKTPFISPHKTAFVAAAAPIDILPVCLDNDKRKAAQILALRTKESMQDTISLLLEKHPSARMLDA